MISHLIEITQGFVMHYGAWGVATASFIEEVVVPIPSALVMMSSGFFFLGGRALSPASLEELFFTVVTPLASGLTIGSLLVYFLTFRLGKPVIERYGGWIDLTWDNIERIRNYFEHKQSDEIIFFGLRSFPFIPSVAINAFCGLTRMPFWRYTAITFFGSLVRASLISFVGWQTGSLYLKYAEAIDNLEGVVFILIAVFATCFIGYKVWQKRKRIRQSSR